MEAPSFRHLLLWMQCINKVALILVDLVYKKISAAEFNAPLFLDCCGLIRKVLRDLKEDFGFEIGPWNQAYMVRFNLLESVSNFVCERGSYFVISHMVSQKPKIRVDLIGHLACTCMQALPLPLISFIDDNKNNDILLLLVWIIGFFFFFVV